MADVRLHQMSDDELGGALRGLAAAIAWPSTGGAGGTDLATAVRIRVESIPVPTSDRAAPRWDPRSWWSGGRSARRALILALVALLGFAAIAGAVGLGLPGLRLILGEVPPSLVPATAPAEPGGSARPSGLPGPLGARMALGEALDPADRAGLDERAGFEVRLPDDPSVGAPDAAWIDDNKGGQVTLLWATDAELPATAQRDVGLLLGQFRGRLDSGFFNKVIGGGTVVEPVRVAGNRGYWLSGEPHLFFWEGPDGFVDDGRRWVGDVLVWSDGPITYRLETALDHDEAIRIAESVR